MKANRPIIGSMVVAVLALALCHASPAIGATLEIAITPKFAGEDIQPASLRYRTAAGESFSFTRVSFLVSEFALQRADGSWLEMANSSAWFDLERKRESCRLASVPKGRFRALRFRVGLDTNLNHADIARFPAGHPLNPNVNGLHWNWQGGYVFLALEGLWRNRSGQLDGWAYHLARDANSVRVMMAAPLKIDGCARLEIDFDLATLLNARSLSLARDGSSSHSREGDPIAAALCARLPGAFTVQNVKPIVDADKAVAPPPLYLPGKFTPYPFKMSAAVPIPSLPPDNPLTAERVALGEELFNDAALSGDKTISCASCHKREAGLADSRRFSVGVRGQLGARRAMPLFNLAWKRAYFWDGRASSLRAQALMPIQNQSEMDESLTDLIAKLSVMPRYPVLFYAAFGATNITSEKIALALEQFLLTRTLFDSKFDRALRGAATLTDEEKRGFQLFSTEYDPRRGQYGADCFHCHGGLLFQSKDFANNGLDASFKDVGRGKITGNDADAGKFAVPSLRNVALRGPYMHDGRFQTLEAAVAHYCTGVKRSATLDPNLAKHPDGGVPLDKADQRALVAFLKTLTDETLRPKQVAHAN